MPFTKNQIAEYIAVAAIGVITAITAASAHAATEATACDVYKPDIASELVKRGYAFVPDTCDAEKEGEAGFKITVVVQGFKEVIHCNPEKCE